MTYSTSCLFVYRQVSVPAHPDRPPPHTRSSAQLQQVVRCSLQSTEVRASVPGDAGPTRWIYCQHQIPRTTTHSPGQWAPPGTLGFMTYLWVHNITNYSSSVDFISWTPSVVRPSLKCNFMVIIGFIPVLFSCCSVQTIKSNETIVICDVGQTWQLSSTLCFKCGSWCRSGLDLPLFCFC